MGKNDTKTEDKSLVKTDTTTNNVGMLTNQSQQLAKLQGSAQMRALEEAMGVDAADVEVIAAGSLPFWPAFAGAILVGTIQGRREVKTQYKTPVNPEGVVGVYTLRVEQRACLAGTLDGEIFELNPGDNITVLERSVMKELRTRIGQKVGILCVGKKEGKQFTYWDYKIIGVKRSADQIMAASQQFMASVQAKQLEAHTEES